MFHSKQGPMAGAQAKKHTSTILPKAAAPSNAQADVVLDLLGEIIREINVDFIDLCFFAAATGCGKPLLPDDKKLLHGMARRWHALANGAMKNEHS